MIKRELQIFGASVLYFSRLPVPFNVPYNKDFQQLVLTWFPVVGAMVGGIGAGVFWASYCLLPQSVSIVLSLSAMVLTTGAFHEDGFADVCDAFGGGYTKEQIMTIMKDSRVGAYAAIGLVLLFALKISVLAEMQADSLVLIVFASQVVSRWPLLLITKIWPYARKTSDSKSVDTSKPLSGLRILLALLLAFAPLLMFKSLVVVAVVPLLVVASLLFGVWFNKKLGGYTGDCLGATQQINELVFWIFCLALQGEGIVLI